MFSVISLLLPHSLYLYGPAVPSSSCSLPLSSVFISFSTPVSTLQQSGHVSHWGVLLRIQDIFQMWMMVEPEVHTYIYA